MLAHCIATILAGYRSRSFQILGVLGLFMMGCAWLAGSFSGRQPQIVALDVAISGIRISGLMMMLFWCQELIGKEIERRTIYITLTYPRSRASYLLGRFAGIAVLTFLILVVLFSLGVWVAHVSASGEIASVDRPQWLALPVVFFGLWIELLTVAAFTVLIASVSTTPFLPLSLGIAFAIACRMLGPVVDYLLRSDEADKLIAMHFRPLVGVLRWMLPDLSVLDVRPMLLYGANLDWFRLTLGLAHSISYAFILLLLGMFLFQRRQFE